MMADIDREMAAARNAILNIADGWKHKLVVSASSGRPLPVIANAIEALRGSPEWQGVLAYDPRNGGPLFDRAGK